MRTYVDALKWLKNHQTIANEGCRSKMLWKCDCLVEALRMAYEAMVNDDILALKALDCVGSNILMEIKPQFHELFKRDSQEEGPRSQNRTFTVTHLCTACHNMPKDDIVWFLARNSSHRSTGRKSSRANIHCAFCGSQNKVKEKS